MNKLKTHRTKTSIAASRDSHLPIEPLRESGCGKHAPSHWKHILVPVDFSLASMKTLSYASQLAELLGASLYLIHVLGEASLLTKIRKHPGRVSQQQLVDAARAKLMAVARRKVRKGVPTTVSARIGEPDREILGAAARFAADVLILHTEVKRGLERLLPSGITRRTAYEAPCPVLFIPKQVLWQSENTLPLARPDNWRKFLIPIEMSAVGEQTLARGLTIAGWFKANIIAFNVVGSRQLRSRYRPMLTTNKNFTEANGKFKAWVSSRTPSDMAIKAYIGVGNTTPIFLQAAWHLKTNLIVLGIQQFSGWRRWRSAWTISRILSQTPCPILSIPQPPGAVPTRTVA